MQRQVIANSPIASLEEIEATLLITCQSIKNVERESLDGAPVHFSLEEEDNNIFLSQCLPMSLLTNFQLCLIIIWKVITKRIRKM